MKIILNLLIAIIFIGFGTLASADDNMCWTNPATGMQCCVTPEGITVCPLDPPPEVESP